MISSKYIHSISMQESMFDLYQEYESLESILITSLRCERERESILTLEDADDIYDSEGNLILFTEESKNIIEKIGDAVRRLVNKAITAINSVIEFIKSKFSRSDKEINLIEKYTHQHPEFKDKIIASYKANELNIKDPKEVERFITACEEEVKRVESGYYKTSEDADNGFEKILETFQKNGKNIMAIAGIGSGIITAGANLIGTFNSIMKKSEEYKVTKVKLQRSKLITKSDKLMNVNDTKDTWKNKMCRKIIAIMSKEVSTNATDAERAFGKFIKGVKSVASKLPGYDEIASSIKYTGAEVDERKAKRNDKIKEIMTDIDKKESLIDRYTRNPGKNDNKSKNKNISNDNNNGNTQSTNINTN